MAFTWKDLTGPGLAMDAWHAIDPNRAFHDATNISQPYYDDAQKQLQPYSQNGLGAGMDLQKLLRQLMNPGELEDQWSKGYKTSDYGKQLMSQSNSAGMDAASQMGLMGSSAALNNIQTNNSNIFNADRNQYMQDLMQKFMSAINIGGNVYGIGANAAGTMGQNSINRGNDEADLVRNKDNQQSNLWQNLIGGAGKLFAGLF